MALATKHNLPRSVRVLVATCCGLLIAACAAPREVEPRTRPPVGCVGASCSVDVNVHSTVASCEVSVYPDTLPVEKIDPPTHHIKWTIDTPGYRFAQNGIDIHGIGFAVRPGGPYIFNVDDHHSQLGHIKYAVRVVRESDGVACTLLDPYIDNL